MSLKLGTRYLKAAEDMKAKAFCLKVSCDAMLDLSEEDEDKVGEAEDFFEEVFETLTKVTTVTNVNKLIAAGNFVNSPSDVQSQQDSIMKSLEDMIKDARKNSDIASEMIFVELYRFSFGECDKD